MTIQLLGEKVDILNVEIKAKCNNPEKIRDILNAKGAEYKGIDNQTDTYFHCENGRLKLRQGNIENSLIFYNRENKAGPKTSDIAYSKVSLDTQIKNVLTKAYGVFIEVKKSREIYFIENVKFHIDTLADLGNFVEIEAIDDKGIFTKEELEKQCKFYLDLFSIEVKDLITHSYSDMLNI
jgi:predicted adenylyl cyclase CyaB